MFYYLSKVVHHFIFPLNVSLLLFIGAVIAFYRRRNRLSLRLTTAGVVFLWTASAPVTVRLLGSPLESAYPSLPVEEYSAADVIVVLGGTEGATIEPRVEAEEMHGSRHLLAARLFKAQKAPWVIVSGGQPYQGRGGRTRARAEDMRDILVGMGIPSDKILLEDRSRNTFENALFTAEILKSHGWSTVLLVTSAFHMKRAVRQFEAHGVAGIVPASSDRHVLEDSIRGGDFFPDGGALDVNSRFIKEYFGYLATLIGK